MTSVFLLVHLFTCSSTVVFQVKFLINTSHVIACMNCRKKIYGLVCENSSCSSVGELNSGPYFSVPVSLMDHTGTIEKLTLFGETAQNLFGILAGEFQLLHEEDKFRIQDLYMWRYFKVYLKVEWNCHVVCIV
eukprot:TRINITY_DN4703_c0_g1_i8.p2 TRINITY_DN4703_c0_g1~~TRINITY_DN4703_c0_g1_i8.p2  ORF type:complete len:133 (-),score=22.76 TRINITY_DN4703_c0_g1_i8:223-621(-)